MLSNYVINLKNKTGLSYKALAKELDIKYPTFINMRDGDIKNVSLQVLEKFSNFLKKDKIEVLYDILFEDRKDLLKDHSNKSLLFLCKLYIENYSIDERYIGNFSVFNISTSFEGYAYRKNIAPNYLVVDSWTQLELDYKKEFKESVNLKDIYRDYNKYLYNIYMYAVGKFFNCTSNDIRRYYIVVDDEDVYSIVKQFNVKGASTYVIPLLIRNIDDISKISDII